MKNYVKENDPFIVPTDDLKLIAEHFGNSSNKYSHCSIAKMEYPPRWVESYQNPEFDEFILMDVGKIVIHIDGEKVELKTGESFLTKKGARVKYTNPFDFPAKYWSICLPPFSLDLVNKEKKFGI